MNIDKAVEIVPTVSTELIKEIISRISRIPVEELDDDVRIREDLGVDSIMAMEIIATLEVKLGFTFDVDRYSCIDEVGEFIEIVRKLGTGRNEG